MDKQKLLETGSAWRVISSLAVPTVIITLVMVVYNMADVFFIGKTNNTEMVNAIAVCMPVFTIIQAFGTLIGTGGCTAISVMLGRGKKKDSRSVSSFCFWFCMALGAALAIILNIFANQIVSALGVSDASRSYAILYLRVLAFGAPVMMFSNSFVNILRADGSAGESMAANLTGTFINIILDPIFILVLGMGVVGAAVATVIGNAAAAVIVIIVMRKKTEFLSFNPRHITKKFQTTLMPLGLGVPVASGTLMLSFGYMLINHLLLAVSPNSQGAFGICRTIMLLSTMVQLGICMGVQPAVSYNYGRRNVKRVKELIVKTIAVCVVFGLLAAAGCIGFRDVLLGAFIKDSSVIEYGRTILFGCFVTAPVYVLFQGSVTFLQSTEQPLKSTIITLLRQGIILIPSMLILNIAAGFNGLVFCFAVTDIITAAIGVVLLYKRLKDLKMEVKKNEQENY